MSSNIQTSLAPLRSLLDLLKSSVDNIEKICIANEQPFPNMDRPFSMESEAVRMRPETQLESSILVAAASQLIATVRSPLASMMYHSFQYHVSSCLRIAIECHVPETLRSAGPKGLHVNNIAALSKINARKLARVLRVLATHHIFVEVAPDTFAHNRISSCMDTGKDLEGLLVHPEAKHDGTHGFVALAGHCLDENFKTAAYLQEVLCDPSLTDSSDPTSTAFNKAFGTDLSQFVWFEQPENAFRLRRFGAAMKGVNSLLQGTVTKGFAWTKLAKDSIVVDVGGGVGSQSLSLAQAFGHLNFIVQDRQSVIGDAAVKFWQENMPEALSSGRVKLQVHDFFEPQQVQRPAVFLLRMILHDWADEYCLDILRHLRAAAGPDTKLVVVDNVMSYACPAPSGAAADMLAPPAPLLGNFGVTNAVAYLADMQMLGSMNAQERTLPEFEELFKNSGWKLLKESVPQNALMWQGVKIVCVPNDIESRL